MTDQDIQESQTAVTDPASTQEHGHEMPETGSEVHLPPTSLWPITLAFAISIMASSLVLNLFVLVPGLILFILALRGWSKELLDGHH